MANHKLTFPAHTRILNVAALLPIFGRCGDKYSRQCETRLPLSQVLASENFITFIKYEICTFDPFRRFIIFDLIFRVNLTSKGSRPLTEHILNRSFGYTELPPATRDEFICTPHTRYMYAFFLVCVGLSIPVTNPHGTWKFSCVLTCVENGIEQLTVGLNAANHAAHFSSTHVLVPAAMGTQCHCH
jgi:hypothetical protein